MKTNTTCYVPNTKLNIFTMALRHKYYYFHFFEWENWDSENLSNLPKVRYSVNCMDKMQIQVAVQNNNNNNKTLQPINMVKKYEVVIVSFHENERWRGQVNLILQNMRNQFKIRFSNLNFCLHYCLLKLQSISVVLIYQGEAVRVGVILLL